MSVRSSKTLVKARRIVSNCQCSLSSPLLAKSRKPRKKQNDQVKVIKSTTIKTHEVSKTIGPYEATMSGAVYYKNTFEPALKSKRAPVFVRGSRHSHHRMTEQQKRSTQAERQMDVSIGVFSCMRARFVFTRKSPKTHSSFMMRSIRRDGAPPPPHNSPRSTSSFQINRVNRRKRTC